MIEKLIVKNFQCHKKATLDFAPGVNVIAGTSDSGKSALLKALVWLATNRPSGLGFRHWDCEKGDIMEASIEVDRVPISRLRSEQVNKYLLDGENYVAMKTDVPSEIQYAHGLEAINIQTQFAPHYLLSQSAGEVAKVLNEACDLSIIDRTVKKIKAIAQEAKAEAQAAETAISKAEKELSGLDWVDDAETSLELLETEMGHIQRKDDQIAGIFSILQDLWGAEEKIAEISVQLPLYAPLDKVAEAISAFTEKDREAAVLDELLHDLKSVQDKIAKIKIVPVSGDAEKAILAELQKGEEAQQAADDLRQLIADLEAVEEEGGKVEAGYKAIVKELEAVWREADACPLCGTMRDERRV